METNAFECPYCKKYTSHVELSLRGVSALERESEFDQFGAGLADRFGLKKHILT